MAIAQLITLGATLTDDPNFSAGGNWDGYACSIGREFPEGPFQGYQLNWGGFDSQNTINPFQNQPYSGYTTNWGIVNTQGTLNALLNQNYVGYNTNWGSYSDQPLTASIENIDMDSVVDYPKDQFVYYKLKGYNPTTQEYEAWVVKQIITARTQLDGAIFDPIPGREPPEVERDVFKTPPSGNTLVNIVIVGRWME